MKAHHHFIPRDHGIIVGKHVSEDTEPDIVFNLVTGKGLNNTDTIVEANNHN